MIKRIVFVFVAVLATSTITIAQDNSSLEEASESPSTTMKGAYLELGGNAGIYSFNYEHFFYQDKINLAGRIGFGLVGEGLVIKPEDKKGMDFMLPFGINATYSISGGHYAELGLGATFHTGKVYAIETSNANLDQQPLSPSLERVNDFWTNFSIGYRYQKESTGMYYRGFFNGHFTRKYLADDPNSHSQYSIIAFDPWFGLSVGYAF